MDGSISDEIRAMHARTLALETVCAILIGELALLADSPANKLATITAGLQGVAAGVADRLGITSIEVTRTIDRISEVAEHALVQRRAP